ncbi:MAG: channel protein TolC [Deltaproteobacteria bacterium]|nr:channel protein TolC [Deltaproteobacteria bacterium]
MKKTLLASLIGLAFSSGAWAATDLLNAYRDAIAYDAQFASARASADAGREKLPQGRAGLLPSINATANTTWNKTETTRRTTPPGYSNLNYNSHGWTATLTQPIFRWQNWMQYQQGELGAAQAEVQFNQAKQDLIVRVAQAYFDVLLAQETLASAQALKAANAEQLEAAKRNFEVGTATITDSHEAQARFDLATAQALAAESDLEVKRQALSTVTGKAPEALKTIKAGVKIARPQPDDIAKWIESAEQGGLVVQLGQLGLEVADREVSKQRSGHLPTLDLVATTGKNSATQSSTVGSGYDSNSSTVGLQLTIPIFAGGATMSKDREAVALREKALADLDNARRQSALAARQAYLGVSSGLSQVQAYEAAVISSQSALDSNKLGYEVGVRINIDVLNAQSQLYDTRQKLMKARLDTLAAQLKLKAAAGNLGEDDVVAINALLE